MKVIIFTLFICPLVRSDFEHIKEIGFKFWLEPGIQECYHELLEKDSRIYFMYEILNAATPDDRIIAFFRNAYNGSILALSRTPQRGHLDLTINDTTLIDICMDHETTDHYAKYMSVFLHVYQVDKVLEKIKEIEHFDNVSSAARIFLFPDIQMSVREEQLKLEQCLQEIISLLSAAIKKLKPAPSSQVDTPSDGHSTNSALDMNTHSFSLDALEQDVMQQLQTDMEEILKSNIPRLLLDNCKNYLLNFLYEFDYNNENHQFKSSFNVSTIDSFLYAAQGVFHSLKSFQAAWDGELEQVKSFLEKYPHFKDKSGLFGTTLLYSAARNNHMHVVKYLIEDGRCSVNAQNQQHIARALPDATTFSAEDCSANPTAGSTALHGACFRGHLQIVMYLVEHKANYYLLNHAYETPIMNARTRKNILKFFSDYLVLGYSLQTSDFPEKPIDDDAKRIVDCFWEYKPCADENWYKFSAFEAGTLQKALTIESEEKFKQEIHLVVSKGVYGVSMIKFLRSGKDQDYKQKLAWVRCRGSSILNFGCYAVWQIMFLQHPQGKSGSTLDMSPIPVLYDSTFVLHLSSWYYCDARISDQLEKTMSFRRKEVTLKLPLYDQDEVTFNLQTFAFANSENTIRGYIRWIPKMISNNPRHRNKIISIDQYETLANLDPVPLTTARFKRISKATAHDLTKDDDDELNNFNNDDDGDDDNDVCHTIPYDDDEVDEVDASDKTMETPVTIPRSISDLLKPASDIISNDDCSSTPVNTTESVTIKSSSSFSSELADNSIEDCINEAAANDYSTKENALDEKTTSSVNDKIVAAMNDELIALKQKNNQLEQQIEQQQNQVQRMLESSSVQSVNYEQKLASLLECLERMKAEQDENKREQEKLGKLSNSIKSVEYKNIQEEVIHDFFTPKQHLILKKLREAVPLPDPSFADRIPKLLFHKQDGQYIVVITGFPKHHDELKAVLRRIWTLLNVVKSAKDFYQRQLNRTMKTMMQDVLSKVKTRAQAWYEYKKLFSEFLREKTVEYKKQFDEHLRKILLSLQDSCIQGTLLEPWKDIQRETNDFMKNTAIMREIEGLKQKALDEFIKQNITMQRLKLDSEPTVKSARVVENFIQKVRNELRTDKKYHGCTVQEFFLIPKLLERLMLYHSCFKLQLPLYESSETLLDYIEKNAVTTISTSTGSGKSTLLPALLAAEGYDRVIVTQPRRLPCQLISRRVNKTMLTDIGSATNRLAGWCVSNAGSNQNAKVLYLTDGLLKERLLKDDNFITAQTQLNKSVVFFIDEVHERSVNIDLCLALLARLLTTKPELKTKMKVIISSATLNSSVPDLFRKIPQAGLATFQMPQMSTLHHVETILRPNENVLDIVQELCKKRKRHDQILCFVSSVGEVNECVRLINEISRGTIVAHPLVQSQRPDVQQEYIEYGTVFFSTTIAETSLTFPSLKYVVDTGMINAPIYDVDSKRTILKEIRAAESTIKQRRGRLGRTQPGEYYALYSFKAEDMAYPNAQICQSDLLNLEFSLRISPLKKGLTYMKQFLPDQPTQNAINAAIRQLQDMNILSSGSGDQFTDEGRDLAKLPDFGSLAMSKAVLAGLNKYACGRDLICLACMLGVLNTTAMFKSVPLKFKSTDGDFMTLLNIINQILLVRTSVTSKQFDLADVCVAEGLRDIHHVIRQALRRYTTVERCFSSSGYFQNKPHVVSGDWERIAKSLLVGYSDNVFVSKKELYGKHLHFQRYNGTGDEAILDLQSTLTRPISSAPVALILARDIRHSTAVRAVAILSFVGEIKSEWLQHNLE
ncbi:unnamed protein product, partial [Adineta ricciae]